MRAWLLPAFLFVQLAGSAQERYGLLHSNYAGTDATVLNPARAAGQWPWLDIRFAGVDAFAWNSLVAWTDRQDPLMTDVRNGFANTGNGRVVMRSLDFGRTHRANVQGNVQGPAFSLALGRSTIGVGLRSRAFVSASGISSELGKFILNGLGYTPQHGIRYNEDGMRVLGAAWTEVGVNYGRILHAQGFSMVSAGVNVRYLLGHAAGALQVTDMDYTVQDTARLDIHQVTARYGYAAPAISAGKGWGGDLGLVYERMLSEVDGYVPHKGAAACSPMRYRYRIGVSLIDVGGIRYNGAESGSIRTGALSLPDYADTDLDGVDGADSLLSTATHWTRTHGLGIGLPTALSLQYDQRITDYAYIGLAAVQNLSGRNGFRLRRSNSLAITPRIETRLMELAFPIVLNEYDLARPMVGCMFRIQGFVIGSDHVLPFISARDMHAMDLYMRVRWMIARGPACKKGGGRSIIHRGAAKEMVPCTLPGE